MWESCEFGSSVEPVWAGCGAAVTRGYRPHPCRLAEWSIVPLCFSNPPTHLSLHQALIPPSSLPTLSAAARMPSDVGAVERLRGRNKRPLDSTLVALVQRRVVNAQVSGAALVNVLKCVCVCVCGSRVFACSALHCHQVVSRSTAGMPQMVKINI